MIIQPYNYKGVVTKIVDGDTIDVKIDVGFRIFSEHRIRLLGIDAHELRTGSIADKTNALLAKQYLIDLILGKDIMIHTEKADSFGRYLGQIYLGDLDVNQDLINKGYAVID